MRRPALARSQARAAVATFLAGALAAGCAVGVPPHRSPTDPRATTVTAPTPAAPSPRSDESLVIWAGGLDFGLECCEERVQRLVKSGLFRLDPALQAQPDLASGPCDVSEDLVTIDCPLRATTFHDGTAFTADDVVFTFQVRVSEACDGPCFFIRPRTLASFEALDTHTVRFRLTRPDPTFLTAGLPWDYWPIESQASVEAEFASVFGAAAGLDADELRVARESTTALREAVDPACEPQIAVVEPLVAQVPQLLPAREDFGEGNDFDACGYLFDGLGFPLERLSFVAASDGTDAIAAAYPLLFSEATPIGTGPFRITGITPGVEARLEAFDGYHFGRPASDRVTVRVVHEPEDAARRMARGDGTILEGDFVRTLSDEPGITLAAPLAMTYFALMYNLRPGKLFAQHELRRALQMCIDKEAIVDAATGGTGVAFDSPVPPISWAYQPAIRPVVRDVDAARALIEAAGWALGSDGVYTRDGRRLSAVVPVRADHEPRVRFVELMAMQAADCGMELEPLPVSPDEYFGTLLVYPHTVPGTDQQFDLYFGGWDVAPDPDSDQWTTADISSEESPRSNNIVGLSDARVDELLAQGQATYDQAQRARIYRELQNRIVELQPYLSAWSPRLHTAIDSDLRSTAGELQLDSPYWWWQLETLTVAPSP